MTLPQKMRLDAAHNRALIVEAARATFADGGVQAPMRAVAARAGLGVATVYRHFPTHAALLDAVLAQRVAECAAELDAALGDPDPWRPLAGTVRRFAARQLADRALNEALFAAGAQFAEARRAHAAALAGLVERARAAGAVRGDLTVDDVRAGLLAISALRGRPTAVDRLTDLLLAGMRAQP
ncbi:helix-turn-helix domain-containing protein [Dactylosporangium salmoneum]|uniref:TetR/AcrR family transcriptional regulator n=1 Tax=Dactylosporangium salmoneum TaxID=53361 RepID=A0ABP5TM11_9ACTN